MGDSEKRPRPATEPPELDGDLQTLERLLDIELERLDTAVRIERERRIVFPETSVIIHDILKLLDACRKRRATTNGTTAPDWLPDLSFDLPK